MPGNSKKNGNAVGQGKNQVALHGDDRGTFQEVLDPKNATVLGTDGNVTVDGTALDDLVGDVAGALDGYDAEAVRAALTAIGVVDDNGTESDTSDDTALIGDVVDLGDGNDVMWGDDNQLDTTGNDIILGGDGNDQLRGDGGNDALFGEEGNDVLNGGEGDDYMAGGIGNDVYHVDSTSDVVVENADEGEDTVVSRISGTDLDLNAYDSIENGTLHEDAGEADLVGTDEDNVLTGNSFDNDIAGAGGDDTLFGLDGDDDIDGGEGEDTIVGGIGADDLTGGADADAFVYNSADEGGDTITDFSGFGGEADTIDLTALGLDDIATGVGQDAIADGYVFLDGNSLYVDIDGGGTGDGTGDDVLIANLNTAISLTDDVLL